MSDRVSITSSTGRGKPPRTPGEGKKVGFARPTLIIPPPQVNYPNSAPYSAQYTAHTIGTPGSIMGPTPGMYGRKASVFMFSQINGLKNFTYNTAKSGLGIGEKCSYWIYDKFRSWSKKWFTHFFLTFVLTLYTLGGAVSFVAIEGRHEQEVNEQNIRPERYQLVRELRNMSIELPVKTTDKEWEGKAEERVRKYEEVVVKYYQNNQKVWENPNTWTMWNAIVYCATIYTTIGYGHICPQTTTGRALTIVYSIVGIPLFLIALTDFGKLFTRGIKFLWSFVRRVYYTGSCRKVRKTAHVQEIFKGAQMMYEIATFRRPSAMTDEENPPDMGSNAVSVDDGTPTTPNISNFEIDDEFNLPISVALFILISYIFCGAVIYSIWEHWKFFDAFYFVFVSMSTIGFGDYVPKEPICMIVSIVYLVFGLALMSMCINVVQEKLTDTFKNASAKLGATMGLDASETGSVLTAEQIEIAPIHETVIEPVPPESPTKLTPEANESTSSKPNKGSSKKSPRSSPKKDDDNQTSPSSEDAGPSDKKRSSSERQFFSV